MALSNGAPRDGQGRFAEVAVFVPVRPHWHQGKAEASSGEQPLAERLQLFHYGIPDDLRSRLAPGHVVRVPFGRRTVKGVVMRRSSTSPVATRLILDLVQDKPVLGQRQLELAGWMAAFYGAPLSSCLSLFVPPGLLGRNQDRKPMGPRMDWYLQLAVEEEALVPRLLQAGRATRPVRLLEALDGLRQATGRTEFARAELQEVADKGHGPALKALADKGLVGVVGGTVHFTLEPAAVVQARLALRGSGRWLPPLQSLSGMGGGAWKSDLPGEFRDLETWRRLQAHGLVFLDRRRRPRDPLAGAAYPRTRAVPLTGEQEAALQMVLAGGNDASHRAWMLQGVTGSGKTEVYLQVLEACLDRGRQAIVLVPEIALTPQTVSRFAGRFPGRVSVMHSGLTPGQRFDVWNDVLDGKVDILVGARSALFAPMPNLGLIVVDEEHDDSYKQSAELWGGATVFYDARRVALRMSEALPVRLLMGSATPSLQTLHRVKQGTVRLLRLPHRIHAAGRGVVRAELPPIELVDMRQELMAGNLSVFSRLLQDQLAAALARREQAILFINRRGTRTFVMCRMCGHVMECTACTNVLTWHSDIERLQCHTCGREFPNPSVCPACGDGRIRYFGSGTQRIAAELSNRFPGVRVLRWDADSAGGQGGHTRIMESFQAHEADVLVGTQMIAKGLDLPRVTVVGAVAADVGVNLPDFRAAERACQLLIQVAGRAGRSERGGRVVIQTYNPEHYAIRAAARHDYEAFCRAELAFRRQVRYPPYRRLARLIVWDRKQEQARRHAATMMTALEDARMSLAAGEAIELIGPAPPFHPQLQSWWRMQILVLAEDPVRLIERVPVGPAWRVDVDPVSTL